MRRMRLRVDRFRWANLSELAALVVILVCFVTGSVAQQAGQKTFASPEEASKALVAAAQGNDEKAMLEILGPSGKQVVSSGDEAEDAQGRANFAKRYEEMHRLVKEPDGTVTLYIGAENWPTPIPLVKHGNSWYFDTEAGKQDILRRRIGRNELSAIRVCQELVVAEKEYYAAHNVYAEKIVSDEGQRNGLYWKSVEGGPKSPVGPLVAAAFTEDAVQSPTGAPSPYRGYYYRILTAQGTHGPGGAKSFIVDGKMTGGFAFVAFPAEYRSSGVMTFIVGDDGVVYQKDLGAKTETQARAMKKYSPNSTWQKAEEPPEEITAGQGAGTN